jgi:hypothetical protein
LKPLVELDGTPFKHYPWIKQDVWNDVMRLKTTDKFKDISAIASELTKSYNCPHKMGTSGIAGMPMIWEKEDVEANLEGCKPVLSHIKDARVRRWARARDSSYEEVTGEPNSMTRQNRYMMKW